MNLPYSEELNIGYLSRLFDNTSECYKLFWFKAIVTKVYEGKVYLSYEELVDHMIADAWYMVTEYHLNLGPRDTLEDLIHLINDRHPELKSSEKESVILEFLKSTTDKDILAKKRTLTFNVPYRLQAPFLQGIKGSGWNVSQPDLILEINKEQNLIYHFERYESLNTRIIIQEDWAEYIRNNYFIIQGWIEYNMIHYLQRRNPSVPGIADKLSYPKERKLEKIKNYWKKILEIEPVREIYNDQILSARDLSIDHFVPWSYVAHDEFWNLHPTTKSINSSKSNNLPDWETYFDKFAKMEYQSYKMIWQYDSIHIEFEKCSKEHINNDEVRFRLYREGLSQLDFYKELESIVMPVYKAALNCGFGKWEYKE